MRIRASVVLILLGIIFAAIYAWWALVPLLLEKPLKVTWTDEATYFYGNYTAKVFDAVGGAVETSFSWSKEFAQEIANQTDSVVHIIDVRVGMAMVWWELSHSSDTSNLIFPGRWTWDRWTADQLGIEFTPVATYDRLKEAEGMAEDIYNLPENWLPVDWSFAAWKYYWNPGERYYDIPDQPDCMEEVLRIEADGNATEFRAMFANATVKAEELAIADDKIVDLQDLRDALAIIIQQQHPERYSTLADAQARLEELEAEAGCSQVP